MKYRDPVYGTFDVQEPVLVELMKSRTMARIKDVKQSQEYYYDHDPKRYYSRFDHCVGVMLLLRQLGASLEEQTAGLLHDASHGVFSHVIDYVFGKGETQDYAEHLSERIIRRGDAGAILKRHGFDPVRISDESHFTLLDTPIPSICADRIDYNLRDAVSTGRWKPKKARDLVKHLTTKNARIVFTNKGAAREFAELFQDQQLNSWFSPVSAAAFALLAKSLKAALEDGVLTREDLFTTETLVIDKLKSSHNPKVLEPFNLLASTPRIIVDEKRYDFEVPGKLRFVDPPVAAPLGVRPLSELDSSFKKSLENFKRTAPTIMRVRVERRARTKRSKAPQ